MRSEKGFSLFEVLIAIGIAASVIAFGAGMIGNRQVKEIRAQATKLMRVIKYSYFQAASQNQYYRISFDLTEDSYVVESSTTPFYVVIEGDEKEEIRKKNEEAEEKSAGSDDEDSGPSDDAGDFQESEDDLLKIIEFPDDVKLDSIYVQHQKEPITEGKAYLYFFPRGHTEFAVIYLSDTEDETTYTLIVNPLNASVEVRDEIVDYEEILNEWNQETDAST